MRTLSKFLGIAALSVFVACGGGGDGGSGYTTTPTTGGGNTGGGVTPGGSTPVTTNAVGVSDNSFTPGAIQVSPGTTVTWTWASSTAGHNVTFSDGVASATLTTGTFTRTFASVGTFSYNCTLHAGMTGTVTVK